MGYPTSLSRTSMALAYSFPIAVPVNKLLGRNKDLPGPDEIHICVHGFSDTAEFEESHHNDSPRC